MFLKRFSRSKPWVSAKKRIEKKNTIIKTIQTCSNRREKSRRTSFVNKKKTHPPHVYPLCIKIVFQLLEIELLVLQLAHGMSLSHDANVHTHHGTLASIPSILRRGERGSLGLRRRRRRMSLRGHHVE